MNNLYVTPPPVICYKELASCIAERNTSQQDAARLFEMLELLKQKYSNLIDLKASQADELLKVLFDSIS